MTPDKVAEMWAEFSADHYEIVEQLPLELHRNSRLLRELDQESLCECVNTVKLMISSAGEAPGSYTGLCRAQIGIGYESPRAS